MTNTTKIILALLNAVWISGCATTATQPFSPDTLSPDTVILVVTIASSDTPLELYKDPGVGSMFGAVGALVQEAVHPAQPSSLQEKITRDLGDWQAEPILRDQVVRQVRERGIRVHKVSESLPVPREITEGIRAGDPWDEIATRWYNPDTSVFDHSALIYAENPNIIIETGYQGEILLFNLRDGPAIVVTVLIKAIDTKTSKVIARARSYAYEKVGEYDLNSQKQRQEFIKRFKGVAEKVEEKLVGEILTKMQI